MSTPFRWGILGTGNIARKFSTGVAALPDHVLTAVGSRTQAAADRFGNEFAIPRRHASYEALAADPNVDAIYIATPHSLHKENTLLCLRNGKHVLVEKPFAINLREAEAMVEEARTRKLFLMEAMWTRFLPLLVEVRRLVADGAIGKLRMVQADFGYRAGFNPASRVYDPALGGGGLLDVGIYPLSLAFMLLGRPDRVAALAEIGPSQVDDQTGMLLGFPGGELAVLSTAVATTTPMEATIMGTDGWIHLPSPWWVGHTLVLRRPGKEAEVIECPYIANGYSHEAIEVAQCVAAGRLESEVMSLDESLALMATMDEIRRQIGLTYPAD